MSNALDMLQRPRPGFHAPYTGEQNPTAVLADLKAAIEHEITNQPRSLQTRIGPSEIGNPCDHCLAAKLAGWEQTEDTVPWLPYVGTAMHTQLEELFIRLDNQATAANTNNTGRRWIVEGEVLVGHIGGVPITGHCDLFDIPAGQTVDWKLVGATTLRSAKKGPTPTYRCQAHLYGKGWEDAGFTVRAVSIYYLPRNAVALDQGVPWHEPYDRAIAEAALERANHLHDNLTALAPLGDAVVNQWITGLPRDPHCRDCNRYADRPTQAAPTSIDDALGVA